MKKLAALLPWNLCLFLTTMRVINEGMALPTFQFPFLESLYSFSSASATFVYVGFFLIMTLCAWASYRILFTQAYELLVDTIPNYLIFVGTRYVVPILLIEYISTEESSILRHPMIDNPGFWMTFGYFMMMDTVIFWRKFKAEEKISVSLFGFHFDVPVRYVFWLTVLVQSGYVTTKLNSYTRPEETEEENKRMKSNGADEADNGSTKKQTPSATPPDTTPRDSEPGT